MRKFTWHELCHVVDSLKHVDSIEYLDVDVFEGAQKRFKISTGALPEKYKFQ